MKHDRTLSLAAALFLAGAAAAAQAQQATVAGLREVEDESQVVQPLNVTVDRLEDMDIYGPNGDEIGEVEEVVVDAAGKVALTAEVGGFLGIGEREVVLGLEQVRLENDRLVTSLTKQQLEALPRRAD